MLSSAICLRCVIEHLKKEDAELCLKKKGKEISITEYIGMLKQKNKRHETCPLVSILSFEHGALDNGVPEDCDYRLEQMVQQQ
jgi:hypothetical protein